MNPKTNLHEICTVFILVIEVSILYYIWQFYSRENMQHHYFNVLLHILKYVCRVISLLNIFGTGLFDQKRFMVPLEDFANIDRGLKSVNGFIDNRGTYRFLVPLEVLARIDQGLKSVNGFIDNRGTYRFQILLGIYLGLILLIFGSLEIVLHLLPAIDNGDEVDLVIVIDHLHCMTVMIICVVMDCFFLSTLSVIEKRLKEINLVMHRAQKHGSHPAVNFFENSRARTDIHVLDVLRTLRIQYHELWKIARQENEAHGLHLLVGATISLALLTNNLWSSYISFIAPGERNFTAIAECTLWALFYVTTILLLVTACESTVAEAKATFVVLQELGMTRDTDRKTKSEIREFFTQLQFEGLKFTAWGFFDIDYSLICSVLAAACTYLVILIQMGYSIVDAIAHYSNKSIQFDKVDHL